MGGWVAVVLLTSQACALSCASACRVPGGACCAAQYRPAHPPRPHASKPAPNPTPRPTQLEQLASSQSNLSALVGGGGSGTGPGPRPTGPVKCHSLAALLASMDRPERHSQGQGSPSGGGLGASAGSMLGGLKRLASKVTNSRGTEASGRSGGSLACSDQHPGSRPGSFSTAAAPLGALQAGAPTALGSPRGSRSLARVAPEEAV